MNNPTVARRQNALALFQEFAEKSLAAGAAPKGLEQAFAARLQMSPSMWSQIKSSRPIGDKLARQVEQLCGKPAGWLDEPRATGAQATAAEQQFLELALRAWRGTGAQGRRTLRAQMAALVREIEGKAEHEGAALGGDATGANRVPHRNAPG